MSASKVFQSQTAAFANILINYSTHHFLLYNLFNFRQITPVECFTVGWIGRLYAVIVADNLRCVLNRFHRWRQLKALERIFNLLRMMLN